MVLIGYSGHAFVLCGIADAANVTISGYCDNQEKLHNPFRLKYLGTESSEAAVAAIKQDGFFIGIGDNNIRRKIYEQLTELDFQSLNLIHPSSVICPSADINKTGTMIAAGAIINPLANIGTGVICNTGCIIEHECMVGNFAHIGPGAVLCGNVSVGENSFIGAGAVVRQGIAIGKNVTVGAGSVVVKDVADGAVVKGCPAV